MADLRTKMYYRWSNIKRRCQDKNFPDYKSYGGRGINICDRWLSFENFYNDLYKNFRNGLTLDRIDNNGNYEPKNCRWATRKEQANNRRSSRNIKYQGKVKTLQEWIEYFCLKGSTVRQRYYVYKFPLEKCFK